MMFARALAFVAFVTTYSVQPVFGQDPHLLVITGLGGDPEYSGRFQEMGSSFVATALEKLSLPPDNIIYLGEDATADPHIRDRSTRENVDLAFTNLASNTRSGDHVFVVLIGHGSFNAGESRFNLPGPDLTAEDFGLHLDQLSDRQVTFVNLSSASGEFIKALSGSGRTIVTATRTGREGNDTVFGGYFINAFIGDAADLDKDGRVSVWEAFEFARVEVTREYETSNRIATEHAALDDNGDGEGSTDLADAMDGALARERYLAGDPTLAAARATDDPELRALLEQKADLERRIDELRSVRDQLAQDRYESDLEELLIELALANRAIRARETGGN
jgi:hypothetical protein